jgi:hypothetical protein
MTSSIALSMLLPFLALPARPALAQSNALPDFGIPPGYAEAQEKMMEFNIEMARQRRASGPKTKFIGDIFNPSRVPGSEADGGTAAHRRCILQAVAGHLGVENPGTGISERTWYASVTLLYDFRGWYYDEYGINKGDPVRIYTVFMPKSGVIFMDDEGVSYDKTRTIDDALAGQYALYLRYEKMTQAPDSPESKASAAETEKWFNSTFTAAEKSPCNASR